jgi:hypothetical protein
VGTGSTGHALEVKQGGSVEVRNSRFEGDPSEDHIQFENNDPSVVRCNVFATRPGEDHIDTKPGERVRIEENSFAVSATGRTLQNHNSHGEIEMIGNTGELSIFYESGASGSLIGNQISRLDLYDVRNVLVEDNEIAYVKHGEGLGSRDPVDTYFRNNAIEEAANNGGTCYRDGTTDSAPIAFCINGAPAWYTP